jgi:hypothetical protein
MCDSIGVTNTVEIISVRYGSDRLTRITARVLGKAESRSRLVPSARAHVAKGVIGCSSRAK